MHNLLYHYIAFIHCSSNYNGNSVYADNLFLSMQLNMFTAEIEKLMADKLDMNQIEKIQEACYYWWYIIGAKKDQIEEEINKKETLYKDEVHECLPER